jgi:hypothetical protein
MAYITNIPGPNDLFSQSQPQILGNFTAIKTLIDVNHVDFDDATDQGKHKFVSLVSQVAAPTLNNTADVIAYGFSTGITGKNEMFISKVNQVTVTQINATGSILSNVSNPNSNTEGWTFLPSGILIKWGSTDINSTVTPLQTFNYAVGANIPVFTKVFSVQLTTYSTQSTDQDKIVTLVATGVGVTFPNTHFSAIAAQRNATGVYVQSRLQYLAIGIGGF